MSDASEQVENGSAPLPRQFASLAEYVLAVAERVRASKQLDERKKNIFAGRLGLLNAKKKKTLGKIGSELGLTRERVRQVAAKLKAEVFSKEGKAMFAEFVDGANEIFSRHNWVVKSKDLVKELNEAYDWSGTTAFSVRRLLGYCGIKIEDNASGRDAWMDGGRVGKRYETFLRLLEDENVPIESLALEEVSKNADSLGLEGITEDEYMFFVQRVIEKKVMPRRLKLFFKLRCGMDVGDAAARRYVEARALRKAGMRGLTHAELVDACREIDPSVDIGGEQQAQSDADQNQKYDMDGTGARLLIYDFGDATHERRYSLDVFFKDEELIRVVEEAGNGLRKHMEANSLGAASITRLVDEINDCLPEPYASEELPSACIYWLMREHNVAGLRYYGHPHVAHPDILDENGHAPEKALGWVAYEYFSVAGYQTATWGQVSDFCEMMLGMNRTIAAATVVKSVVGERVVVKGENKYMLKPPDETVDAPNVLLGGGKIDSELSFARPKLPLGMVLGEDGKARNFSTYVRLFLLELAKSGYAFTEDEEHELADPGWCGANLGPNKAVFVRAEPGSTRPSHGYWRVTYRVGKTDYWVNGYWSDRHKGLFDQWAQALAGRAGFEFEPYEIQYEEPQDKKPKGPPPLFENLELFMPTGSPPPQNDEDPSCGGLFFMGNPEESEAEDQLEESADYLQMALSAFERRHWAKGLVYAAKTDMADARLQYYMGYCCENGFGTDQDLDAALEWYRKSAKSSLRR